MNKATAKRAFSGLLVALGIWGSLGSGLAEASTPEQQCKVAVPGVSIEAELGLCPLDDEWGSIRP
ncbi:hypothetical protein ACIGFK_41455 [Streptomyces sp. NPDC085524]|uniref:hypothetical protein n=1 Tax=unclassified Streptomyces TaxID=2593676 RepID=UPI0035E1D09D